MLGFSARLRLGFYADFTCKPWSNIIFFFFFLNNKIVSVFQDD
jgi:hypothetical protein